MSRTVNWNSVFKIYIPVSVNVSVTESDDAHVSVGEIREPAPGNQLQYLEAVVTGHSPNTNFSNKEFSWEQVESEL